MSASIRHHALRLSASGLCVLAFLFGSAPVQGKLPGTLENQVKAAFLFNFARFVQWPEVRLAEPGVPLQLCIWDAPDFATTLRAIVADKKAAQRHIAVREVSAQEQLFGCHIAYLGKLMPNELGLALAHIQGLNILSVHENEAAVPGGVIRFYLDDRRLRFEINIMAARQENLTLSSKLLAVARLVEI